MTGSAAEAKAEGMLLQGLTPEAARLMRLATYASVAVAGVLIAAKLAAWLATDSVSMLSTLLDSVLDAAASMVNLLAIRHALTPADREHRFGHGKAEPLAALGQAAFVAGSAVLLIVEVARRLWRPQPIENGELGIAVMLGSIVLTAGLVLFQRHVVRKTGSLAISADRLHYVGDVLVNGGVILALVLSQILGWTLIDPIFGAVIAAYILYTAWSIARSSLDMLMDRELPDEDRQRIRSLALAHPEVKALHELRTRASGPSSFIQFHLEMDGGIEPLRRPSRRRSGRGRDSRSVPGGRGHHPPGSLRHRGAPEDLRLARIFPRPQVRPGC